MNRVLLYPCLHIQLSSRRSVDLIGEILREEGSKSHEYKGRWIEAKNAVR